MNNYMYCITHKDQFAERLTKGFTGGNYSTDGNWVIGDKGSETDMNDWCVYRPEDYPQWLTDACAERGITACCMDHDDAKFLVNLVETSKGAADGWCKIPVAV